MSCLGTRSVVVFSLEPIWENLKDGFSLIFGYIWIPIQKSKVFFNVQCSTNVNVLDNYLRFVVI
jgi:hypothetical protein